jgi:broad specificity phosphatase PhoE
MPKLLLVKHSMPVLSPDVPSARWVLSDDGRARCAWLANELRAEGVSRLFASLEPKALETAALVGVACALPVEPRADLHENDRTGLGLVSDAEMQSRIRSFLTDPQASMGNETAAEARERFARAVGGILKEAHGRDVAIVTHGTVLTQFVARHNAVDPYDFWRSLTTPSVVVLESQSLTLLGPPRLFAKAG